MELSSFKATMFSDQYIHNGTDGSFEWVFVLGIPKVDLLAIGKR